MKLNNLLDKAVYNNNGILSFKKNIDNMLKSKCICQTALRYRSKNEIKKNECFECKGKFK